MDKQKKFNTKPPKEAPPLSSLPLSSPLSLPVSLQEYTELSSFVERTSETMHKMTVCLKQLERDIENLKYELKVALNEYANFHHTLEDFEMVIKIKESNLSNPSDTNLA